MVVRRSGQVPYTAASLQGSAPFRKGSAYISAHNAEIPFEMPPKSLLLFLCKPIIACRTKESLKINEAPRKRKQRFCAKRQPFYTYTNPCRFAIIQLYLYRKRNGYGQLSRTEPKPQGTHSRCPAPNGKSRKCLRTALYDA